MRLILVLLVVAPALATAVPFAPQPPCLGLTDVAGQGPSCPVEGGWEVLLADGSTVFTHGPDPLPANGNPHPLTNPPPSAPVACVNTLTQPSIRVVYARPFDVLDASATKIPQIRAIVEQANGLLRAEAAAHGEIADLRVYCTGGMIDVVSVATPTPDAADSFGSIVYDLRMMGLNGGMQKKWVFFDGTVDCACAGQANMYQDDRLVLDNLNNGAGTGSSSTTFAISYQVLDTGVALHELLHTLGAVQKTAPHATAANHCTDGLDVMCYDDGAGYDSTVCSDRTHVDCGGDDYFRPNAPLGTYLATRWNLASHLVKFLRFGTELEPPTVTWVAPEFGFLYQGCTDGIPYVVGRAAFQQNGCVRLELADETGVARVELRLNGVLLATDTSGATATTFTFPIKYTRTGSSLQLDVYDTRGNYGVVTRAVDLFA